MSSPIQEHAIESIAERFSTGRIRPDEIPLNQIILCKSALNQNTRLRVGTDDIPGTGARTSDKISWRIIDDNAAGRISERIGASDIHANEISKNLIPLRASAEDEHSGAITAR